MLVRTILLLVCTYFQVYVYPLVPHTNQLKAKDWGGWEMLPSEAVKNDDRGLGADQDNRVEYAMTHSVK